MIFIQSTTTIALVSSKNYLTFSTLRFPDNIMELNYRSLFEVIPIVLRCAQTCLTGLQKDSLPCCPKKEDVHYTIFVMIVGELLDDACDEGTRFVSEGLDSYEMQEKHSTKFWNQFHLANFIEDLKEDSVSTAHVPLCGFYTRFMMIVIKIV